MARPLTRMEMLRRAVADAVKAAERANTAAFKLRLKLEIASARAGVLSVTLNTEHADFLKAETGKLHTAANNVETDAYWKVGSPLRSLAEMLGVNAKEE